MWQIQKIPKSAAAVDAVSINEREKKNGRGEKNLLLNSIVQTGGGLLKLPLKIKKWNNFKTVPPITAKLSEEYIWERF